MLSRIASELDSSVPMTIVYGSRSWMDSETGDKVREQRPDSYVSVHKVQRAGHHVHAQQPDDFNAIVRNVFSNVDNNLDLPPSTTSSSSSAGEESPV